MLSFKKIESSLYYNRRFSQEQLRQIRELIESDGSNAFSSTIESIGNAAPSLTSNDPTEIVCGVIDIMSTVPALIPMMDPITGSILTLISGVIGAIGGQQGISSVVKKPIDDSLSKFDDSNTKDEAHGIESVYGESLAYLNAMTDRDLQEHEAGDIGNFVPISFGAKFLGVLESKITRKSKSFDKQQIKQAIEYTQLFVKLSILRSAILWKMYITIQQAGHSPSTAAGVKLVIETMNRTDKEFLRFLTSPKIEHVMFFVYLNPSELPEVSKYLKTFGLTFQNLANLSHGSHCLHTRKWSDWYAYMSNDSYGSMLGTKTLDEQGRFFFDTISSKDNIFLLRSVKWPSWYVYMDDKEEGNLYGYSKHPGPSGEWKVIRFSDHGQYFMLSPKKWPDWFIYMKNEQQGTVRGWKGDPGEQGHWFIT